MQTIASSLVGSLVTTLTPDEGPGEGVVGKVIAFGDSGALVEFDGWTGGHGARDDGGEYDHSIRSRWYFDPSCLEVLAPPLTQGSSPLVRTFGTGATRDLDESKLDYEGFLSPYVLDAYAQYMHGKRKMADGSFRDSDNWQKGIPLDAYMKSGWRHFMDWWAGHRDNKVALEPLETALCGLLFNIMGYLHEVIKARVERQPT